MRTGIKTLLKKINFYLNFPDKLMKTETPKLFPTQGYPYWKIKLKIYSLKNYLKYISPFPRLNEVRSFPHPIALRTWNALLPYNPNNIGNWSNSNLIFLKGTQKYEKMLVESIINLYGGSANEWRGYITSGSTESNLHSMWIARNSLMERMPIHQICVLQNDITHYSIAKNSDILNLKVFTSEINDKKWNFDTLCLRKTILNLIKLNYSGFIIPITLGYTQTGTDDNLKEICRLRNEVELKYNVHFYFFIDAALNGLVSPFISSTFKPLRSPIESITVDFHKFGMTPLSCGIILYRKKLQRYVELKVPYLPKCDSTISGSRSGIPAVSAYMVIVSLGKEGFKKNILKSMELKNKFIEIIKQQNFSGIKIINNPNSVSLGVVSNKQLPTKFLDRYGLYAKKSMYHLNTKSSIKYIYKATFINKNINDIF